MTDDFELTPIERAALEGIIEQARVPGERLMLLISELGPHLNPEELRNVRRALAALPDAPEPVRHPRPER